MKKIILILCITLLSGCISILTPKKENYVLTYNMELSEVKMNDTIMPLSESGMSYEDSSINVSFKQELTNLVLSIGNITNDAINLDWEKSSWVDTNSIAERFMRSGEKYSERNDKQDVLSIPGNFTISNKITPNHLIFYDKDLGWREKDLFRWTNKNLDKIRSIESSYGSKSVHVTLCIKIKEKECHYDFKFKLVDPVIQFKGNPINPETIKQTK
jgi:hypothetical protein